MNVAIPRVHFPHLTRFEPDSGRRQYTLTARHRRLGLAATNQRRPESGQVDEPQSHISLGFEVDDDRLGDSVVVERFQALLASEPALLVTACRHTGLEVVVPVDPDHPSLHATGESVGAT